MLWRTFKQLDFLLSVDRLISAADKPDENATDCYARGGMPVRRKAIVTSKTPKVREASREDCPSQSRQACPRRRSIRGSRSLAEPGGGCNGKNTRSGRLE